MELVELILIIAGVITAIIAFTVALGVVGYILRMTKDNLINVRWLECCL